MRMKIAVLCIGEIGSKLEPIASRLAQNGLTVHSAVSPDQAVAFAAKGHFDVALILENFDQKYRTLPSSLKMVTTAIYVIQAGPDTFKHNSDVDLSVTGDFEKIPELLKDLKIWGQFQR